MAVLPSRSAHIRFVLGTCAIRKRGFRCEEIASEGSEGSRHEVADASFPAKSAGRTLSMIPLYKDFFSQEIFFVFFRFSFVSFMDSFLQVLQQFPEFMDREISLYPRIFSAEEAGADSGGDARLDVDLPVTDGHRFIRS